MVLEFCATITRSTRCQAARASRIASALATVLYDYYYLSQSRMNFQWKCTDVLLTAPTYTIHTYFYCTIHSECTSLMYPIPTKKTFHFNLQSISPLFHLRGKSLNLCSSWLKLCGVMSKPSRGDRDRWRMIVTWPGNLPVHCLSSISPSECGAILT